MKRIFIPIFALMSMTATAQNAMLKNPAKGAIALKDITNISIASNGTDAVLIAGDNSAVYAIDIADKDATKEVKNTILSIPNFIAGKLAPAIGQTTVTVLDMEVNPITKALYVLASSGANKYIVKVEEKGAKVSLLDVSNISHSKLTWGTTFDLNDMAFGNNTLYVSSGSFSLDGELGWMQAPFTHNTSFTKRATTMFKSNWGSKYDTKAPLEVLAFGNVGGKNRLMGVTTCAPGFSLDIANLQGSGALQVTEDFNVEMGFSKKVVFMNHDKKEWLFDLHGNDLYRIGKKFIDGSQVAANKYNSNAVLLRDFQGKVSPGLTAEDMKQINSTAKVTSIAKFDEYRLLVLEEGTTGALTLMKVATDAPPLLSIGDAAAVQQLDVYPNPATGHVNINLPENISSAALQIVGMNGSVVYSQDVKQNKTSIDIRNIPAGLYTVTVTLADGSKIANRLTIE